MELSFPTARDGGPSCRAGDFWLHSPYSPAKEAERFIAAGLAGRQPAAVILLGPCLDHLSPAVKSALPGTATIAVQFSTAFRGREVGGADASWYPDDPASLEDFLEAALGDDAVSGVAALEWEPGSRAFPEAAAACAAAVRAVLDRLSSSAATVKVFGRRWIANACRSFLLAGSALSPERSARPAVVAAAGPSLNESLDALARYRGSFALVAVSSALAACLRAGMEPDLVVATDGGFWSRHHLYPLSGRSIPLATALTALPSSSLWATTPLLLLDQGSFAERELLPMLAPALPLPPHGTVAGSAIRLAARLYDGPIIVAGLDLASRGDADHASPHGFDAVIAAGEGRSSPMETRTWTRASSAAACPLGAGPWRISRSLATYAASLSLDLAAWREKPYRLLPSPVDIPGFRSLEPRGLPDLLRRTPAARTGSATPAKLRDPRARASVLGEKLGAWIEMARDGASDLARGEIIRDRGIADLLRSADLPDFAAARRAALRGLDPAPAARALGAAVVDFLEDLRERTRE